MIYRKDDLLPLLDNLMAWFEYSKDKELQSIDPYDYEEIAKTKFFYEKYIFALECAFGVFDYEISDYDTFELPDYINSSYDSLSEGDVG